jgi:hypothetical protein
MNRRLVLTIAGIVLVGALAGLAAGWFGVRLLKKTTSAATNTRPLDDRTYLANAVFTSSTTHDLASALLASFNRNELFAPLSWDVPGASGTKLVIASPTTDGKAQALECGGRHPYCGLYLVTPTTTTLPVWGDDMTGFGGIIDFPDSDHARAGYAWSALNYLEVRQDVLDFKTGRVDELCRLEFDGGDQGMRLSVIVHGVPVAFLTVEGQLINGRLIPKSVRVTDASGKERSHLTDDVLLKLAMINTQGPVEVPALSPLRDYAPNLPSNGTVDLELFGKPFQLDVNGGILNALQTF